ncbi:hypothetical protein BSF41_10860 [Flavobacterium sp. ACN2]|uniref:T9SS sorting signal type C domain-containing protein n=1 Tax=Flavobacterium sp. ACN2 TaxID=1975676 RepID=UPI0011415335|nr:T9SS sorting signal type C domain-containing protein [Flavobacterium sp. ACN2]PBI92602.1 hypothetical protein BSF41_10860 [Flavobacterium sp. ACN2]
MMRKLLYSFLFFIFLHSAVFGQCSSYPSFTTTRVGSSEYTFCTNTTNFTQSLRAQQYVVVNVIKGSTYRFRIPSVWSGSGSNGTEYLGVFDDAAGNAFLTGASATNTTTVDFTPLVSGRVRVLLLRGTSCGSTNDASSNTLTMTQTAIGNTQDDENSYGTDNWVAHVYSAGGRQPTSFTYLGYYNVNTESISENFGGSYNCFPFMSGGVNRGQVYTQGFAVRHKMKTTKRGCYMITVSGDDGVRLYLNGTNILDRWVEQASTTYSNVVVNLDGDDDLIFDYYENDDANSVTFTMVPFDTNSNTITAPATVDFCGTGANTPGQIVGSLQYSSGDPNLQNPQLSFQWQSSTDGVSFNNINTSGTSRNYSPPSITANNVIYYRRLVSISGSSGCTYAPSNVVRISASSSTPPQPGTISVPANICAGSTNNTFSVAAVARAVSYTWSVTGTGWSVTAGGNTASATITIGTGAGTVSVTATNACGTSAAQTLNITPTTIPSQPGTITQPSSICAGSTNNAFSITPVSGATSYTWSVTGTGWSVTAGANTASATITIGTGAGTVSVTATNGCGTSTARTTATLTPITNTITLTSATGTDAQSICFNSAITDITYATTGGTLVAISGFPTGLNITWSGSVFRISGTPNVSSASPYNYTVALQGNCATVTLSGTITVKPLPTAPTITKNHDAACNTLGSITVTGLSGDWTVNQTGATTLPKSYPGPGASLAIQDLAADTYSFTVTDNTTGCTSSPATVTITDTSSNTEWDATGWTNGEPDGSKSVTISYVTASHQPFTIAKPNIQACSLTITSTSNVIIPDGVTLTITNKVTSNGKLVFENGSSLLQTTNVKNDGDIVYKRTTKINRFDLTYWSSPVTGEPDTFKMKDLSSETLFDKFFTYSPTGGWATNMYGMAEMEPGKGYSIRGPQSFDSQTAANFTGEFKGRPNNGDITVPSVVPDKWFLLGNPYPSAIDVDALWDANADQLGALYFWTHVAPPTKAPGENTYRYTSNDYVVYTASGGTVVGGTKTFDGFIAAGQGFFARPKTTEIHFNNDMRRGSSVNGSFFKVASKSKSIERNRIWLNMVNSEGAFKQILVGYIEGATNNVDFNYDAPTISGNSYLDFYSLNETKKLTIQGRALPFENTDLVPLGYKTTVAGDFTIGLDHGDGFFNKQEVYLEDKTTGKTINLRNENYTFSTLVGTFTDRFVLRYTGKTLGTDDLENLENSVLISVKNKIVTITCSKETIKDVTIFNVGAQLIYSKNKVSSSELQITNLQSSDQVLLVKVTLENGSTITKKVIFSNL